MTLRKNLKMLTDLSIHETSIQIKITLATIDIFQSEQIREEIIPVIEANLSKKIIIDVEMLLSFSSSIMATIIEAARIVKPEKITLRNCRPSIKIALELTEVADLFVFK